MITLKLILRSLGLTQSEVLKCLNEKYNFDIKQSVFNRRCNEQGHWRGEKNKRLLELLDKEYGIYYDMYCWKVRDKDGE